MTLRPESLSTLMVDESRIAECPDCGDLGFFRADLPIGHPLFGKPIPCDNPIHMAAKLNRLAQVSNLSIDDLTRRLGDIEINIGNGEMMIAAREMIANPYGWLYIWGGPGNAKSEVLIAIVNEVNECGNGPAMYVTFAHLVNWMREAFREDADDSYIQRFEKLKAIKLLAVDEMDKARGTEFSDEFRFQFLDERYRQAVRGETMMIFASNSNPSTLPIPLWDRIRDGRFKIVENTAPSARPNKKREVPKTH